MSGTSRQLDELANCMNYEKLHGSQPTRFVVHDHRAVLPVIWAAHEDGVFSKPPLLFRIDAHDDCREERVDYTAERAGIMTLDDCLRFANSLPGDDGGWVEAAMKFGWVGDVVTWYVGKCDIPGGETSVSDLNRKNHRIHSHGRIAHALSPRDALGDVTCADKYSTLHESLGWDPSRGWTWTREDPPDIWFDLDLDFAVHHLGDFGNMPWRMQDFFEEFDKPIDRLAGGSWSAGQLIVDVLRQSKLMTIATEPRFSCGYTGVATILERLNRYFGDYGDWFDLDYLQ